MERTQYKKDRVGNHSLSPHGPVERKKEKGKRKKEKGKRKKEKGKRKKEKGKRKKEINQSDCGS